MVDTRAGGGRAVAYREALERLELLLEEETDWVAAMATTVCELKDALDHVDWVGFYRATEDGTLVVGPYQGGHACLRIRPGNGVCGAAAERRETVVVRDVREFEDHIVCDERTLSEIVVPVLSRSGDLVALLDVDSHRLDDFGEEDREGLEELCGWLGRRFANGA